MRTRYAFAAAFVAVVGVLLLLRHDGRLGGRAEGGPLHVDYDDVSGPARPARRVRRDVDVRLDGREPVTVQHVRARFASPGLRVGGPAVAAGQVIRASGRTRISLSATRPGIYYLDDLVVDYKRGSRRFRRRARGTLCIDVRRHDGRNACALPLAVPKRATVAELGGPSAYGAPVRLNATGDAWVARLPATPGVHAVRVTLTNLTRRPVEVADVGLSGIRTGGASVMPLPARPARFRLPPHAGRGVRVAVRVSGCLERPAIEFSQRELNGELDGDTARIPLTVAIGFSGSAACS